LPLPDAMTHATAEEARSWAPSARRWCDHEPALTGLCLVRAQHRQAGLAPRQLVFYRVEFEVESLLKGSHPLPGNDAKVRELLDQSLRVLASRFHFFGSIILSAAEISSNVGAFHRRTAPSLALAR